MIARSSSSSSQLPLERTAPKDQKIPRKRGSKEGSYLLGCDDLAAVYQRAGTRCVWMVLGEKPHEH